MQQFGNMHPRIMIDRHGGRIRYRNDLQLCWPEASIQVLVENKSMSRYRLTRGGNKLTITFASKSDEKHMPVALASMLAKYTRELHMIRFNRYFLEEIPKNFLNYIKNPNSDSVITSFEDVKNPPQKRVSSSTDSIYAIGQVVSHAKFGIGTILNYEGSGDSMRLQIKFQKVGTKWLISSYAKLEIV